MWLLACGCGCTGAGVCLRACSLINPARNAPPYYPLRPPWLHHIFRHFLIQSAILEKKFLNIKCVVSFCLQVVFETFLILGRTEQNIAINVKTSSCKVPVILVGYCTNLNFVDRFSKKSSNIEFQQTPSSRNRAVACGQKERQTHGHDEANSCFWQFRERA